MQRPVVLKTYLLIYKSWNRYVDRASELGFYKDCSVDLVLKQLIYKSIYGCAWQCPGSRSPDTVRDRATPIPDPKVIRRAVRGGPESLRGSGTTRNAGALSAQDPLRNRNDGDRELQSGSPRAELLRRHSPQKALGKVKA